MIFLFYCSFVLSIPECCSNITNNILDLNNRDVYDYKNHIYRFLNSINIKNIGEIVPPKGTEDDRITFLRMLDVFLKFLYDDVFVYHVGGKIPQIDLFNMSKSDRVLFLALELYKSLFFLNSYHKNFDFSCSPETLNESSFTMKLTPQGYPLYISYLYFVINNIYNYIILYSTENEDKKTFIHEEIGDRYTQVSEFNHKIFLRRKKVLKKRINIDQYPYLYTSWSPEIPSIFSKLRTPHLEFKAYIKYLKLRSEKLCPCVDTKLESLNQNSLNFRKSLRRNNLWYYFLDDNANYNPYSLVIHDYKHIHIIDKNNEKDTDNDFLGKVSFLVNKDNMKVLFRLIYFYSITRQKNVLIHYRKTNTSLEQKKYYVKVIYENTEVYFKNFRIDDPIDARKEFYNKNVQEGFLKLMKKNLNKSYSMNDMNKGSSDATYKRFSSIQGVRRSPIENISFIDLVIDTYRIKKRIEYLDYIKIFNDLYVDDCRFKSSEEKLLVIEDAIQQSKGKLFKIFTRSYRNEFEALKKSIFSHEIYFKNVEEKIKILNYNKNKSKESSMGSQDSLLSYPDELEKDKDKKSVNWKNKDQSEYKFYSKDELSSICGIEDTGLSSSNHLDPLDLNNPLIVNTHKVYQTFHFHNLIVLDSLDQLISHYKKSSKIIEKHSNSVCLEKYSFTLFKLENKIAENHSCHFIKNQLRILSINYNELSLENMKSSIRLHIIILILRNAIKSYNDLKSFYPIIYKYYILASIYMKGIIVSTYYKTSFQQSSLEIGFSNKKYLNIEIYKENLVDPENNISDEMNECMSLQNKNDDKSFSSKLILKHVISEKKDSLNDCSKILKDDVVYVNNSQNFHVKKFELENLINLYLCKYRVLYKRI